LQYTYVYLDFMFLFWAICIEMTKEGGKRIEYLRGLKQENRNRREKETKIDRTKQRIYNIGAEKTMPMTKLDR